MLFRNIEGFLAYLSPVMLISQKLTSDKRHDGSDVESMDENGRTYIQRRCVYAYFEVQKME